MLDEEEGWVREFRPLADKAGLTIVAGEQYGSKDTSDPPSSTTYKTLCPPMIRGERQRIAPGMPSDAAGTVALTVTPTLIWRTPQS